MLKHRSRATISDGITDRVNGAATLGLWMMAALHHGVFSYIWAIVFTALQVVFIIIDRRLELYLLKNQMERDYHAGRLSLIVELHEEAEKEKADVSKRQGL